MDSYWAYQERAQNWFFSPNPNLDGATKKPMSFPSSARWKQLTSEQRKSVWRSFNIRERMTLTTLAGFGYEGRGINLDNSTHFSKLQNAYGQWKHNLYSVFWSDNSSNKRWLCNVFVGDAMYLYNRKNFTAANRHYYDPKQIYMGHSFLRKRENYKEVQVGDIVVFKYFGTPEHVEIITDIQNNLIADDGFCSIGAGRSGGQRQCREYKM